MDHPPIRPEGRWPPVYDADSLAETIRHLVQAHDLPGRFYDLGRQRDPQPCQGDVWRLSAPLPLLNEHGEPDAVGEYEYWMVLGSTCDFVRDSVYHSQIVPVCVLDAEPSQTQLETLRKYRYSRSFYVPPWPGTTRHCVADFTQPVTVEKPAFGSALSFAARLSYPAWALLHSCLVRFLARDDGRFE